MIFFANRLSPSVGVVGRLLPRRYVFPESSMLPQERQKVLQLARHLHTNTTRLACGVFSWILIRNWSQSLTNASKILWRTTFARFSVMKAQIKKQKHVITEFAFNNPATKMQTNQYFKLLQSSTAREEHHLFCILDAVRLLSS